MNDVIRLLPDAIANQIAAGEVIQRPASIVKELVENSIDAGSTDIKVIIKDGGKSLVQVIDNGAGMSETDARMAFERHATSKINDAKDLFNLHTLGFRGEALASIAAVSCVELRTKRKEDELGNCLIINGSKTEKQEAISCPAGCNFMVKNLFFNIPVRRKFLKKNSTEFRNIVTEFQRLVLVNPDISFSLQHNDVKVYNLPTASLRQRIVSIFGKNRNKELLDIETNTSVVKIKGYITKPNAVRKTSSEQFMFINNRYMRNPYFHKAIMLPYENMIQSNANPSYFLYLETNTDEIDINIHPTKSEIKFEYSNDIFQIIRVAVREAMGKFNIVPSIDFDQEGSIDIPTPDSESSMQLPTIDINPVFNPFDEEQNQLKNNPYIKQNNLENWESIFENVGDDAVDIFQNEQSEVDSFESKMSYGDQSKRENDDSTENDTAVSDGERFFQFKRKYILTSVKSGLMAIDQQRAHERILYEKYLSQENDNGVVQKLLFPITIELSQNDFLILKEIVEEVSKLGFEIHETGDTAIAINGTPANLPNADPKQFIEDIIEAYRNNPNENDVKLDVRDRILRTMARSSAVRHGQILNVEEMKEIIDSLFACQIPNYTPDGKPIISIITLNELDMRF